MGHMYKFMHKFFSKKGISFHYLRKVILAKTYKVGGKEAKILQKPSCESQWPTINPSLQQVEEVNLYTSKESKNNQQGEEIVKSRNNWNATPKLSKSNLLQ